MKYPKKLQAKKEIKKIICPNCDGSGVDVLPVEGENIPIACGECGGTGQLRIVHHE